MTFVMSVSLASGCFLPGIILAAGNADVARAVACRPLRSGREAPIRDAPLTAENRSPVGPQIIRPDYGVNRRDRPPIPPAEPPQRRSAMAVLPLCSGYHPGGD
jgi:hypothetical protein